MGTSTRRSILWLVLATMAIAAAAVLANGGGGAQEIDAAIVTCNENSNLECGEPVEPDMREVRIVKTQIGGLLDTEFTFTVDCIEDEGTPERIGNVAIDGSGSSSLLVEPRFTHCTVVEFFDDQMEAERWSTTVGQAGTQGRELTVHFEQDDLATFLFQNEWVPPRPEDATVTIRKVFEGPAAWEFGFIFACANQQAINAFALSGGESTTFDVEFGVIAIPVPADHQGEDGPPAGLPCVVGEEELVGDWTVTVDVVGATVPGTGSDSFGTFAEFFVQPGAEVVVTFTNIPGYAAQPPTGVFTLPEIPDRPETR